MNDAEIIKALECCAKSGCSDNETKDCPLKPYKDCSTRLAINTLDLINRQQAEIKKLESKNNTLTIDNAIMKSKIGSLEDDIQTAKSEAIKEFAERLKMCAESSRDYSQWVFSINESQLDNLVKEMTGGEENES